jgi:hypothetical protein
MPQTLFDQQGVFAHADEQGGMGMPLSVCRYLFNSFSKLKPDEKNIEKRRLFH